MTTLQQDLLTDCLGMLDATALLSHNHDETEYYIGSITQLGRHEHVWSTLEAARAELGTTGYIVSSQPVNLAGDYEITHLATAAAIFERQGADVAKWTPAAAVYVRYGALPPGGISRNHGDNTPERGVSVFHGQLLPSGQARAVPSNHVLFCTLLTLLGRQLYVVTGDAIGVGSDGEPILANCRIVNPAK